MRFDDSLDTVLNADRSTPFGVQTAWRQLIDLIGRRRIKPTPELIDRLSALRAEVPTPVRSATARALAYARPPAALVRFLAEDSFDIAAPVLRTAMLTAQEWIELLPALGPTTRSILRHRRDLPPTVVQALETFGAVDLVLSTSAPVASSAPEPLAPPVSQALAPPDLAKPDGTFPIADLVARIDAFQRQRENIEAVAPAPQAALFRFETDAQGLIRSVAGIPREALVGASLGIVGAQGAVSLDGKPAAALRGRSPFADARLVVETDGPTRGAWRLSGTPLFDAAGRFAGYAGVARQGPDGTSSAQGGSGDALRQLVHELRTPANAIIGFAEMIDAELLGPAPAPYRSHAAAIREHAAELIDAIDDLDTSARLDSGALELDRELVMLGAIVEGRIGSLSEAQARRLDVEDGVAGLTVWADVRAVDQLVARLLGIVSRAARDGERLTISGRRAGDAVELDVTRPARLDHLYEASTMEASGVMPQAVGKSLLGSLFMLTLVRRLAEALGGRLVIGADRLTVRLPAGETEQVEPAVVVV